MIARFLSRKENRAVIDRPYSLGREEQPEATQQNIGQKEY